MWRKNEQTQTLENQFALEKSSVVTLNKQTLSLSRVEARIDVLDFNIISATKIELLRRRGLGGHIKKYSTIRV